MLSTAPGPIGIFDSGYGGLTILHGIRQLLPQYDYLYLGDNARAPYGTRSFDVVYEFTRQAVVRLFEMGCHLVILGCNTASAKALRTIQQNDLPKMPTWREWVSEPMTSAVGRMMPNTRRCASNFGRSFCWMVRRAFADAVLHPSITK